MGDLVLFVAGGFDVGPEQVGAQQVDDAQAAARHLVFVGRADAAAGGADLLAARGALGGQLDHAVIGKDDLGAVRDLELAVDIDAELANAGDFLEEGDGVQHHAVADDAHAARAQHAAGNELQHEFLAADDDGVAGVVAAGITRHGAEALAEHVHDLSLALIAPLGAQHHRRFRSHCFPSCVAVLFECIRRRFCGVLQRWERHSATAALSIVPRRRRPEPAPFSMINPAVSLTVSATKVRPKSRAGRRSLGIDSRLVNQIICHNVVCAEDGLMVFDPLKGIDRNGTREYHDDESIEEALSNSGMGTLLFGGGCPAAFCTAGNPCGAGRATQGTATARFDSTHD